MKGIIHFRVFYLLLAILLTLSGLSLAGSTPAEASTPLGHKLTNVNDVKFTVSWVTDVDEEGYIEYGATPALGSIAYDDRGEGTVDDTHYVTVFGTLEPNTRYYYDIISGDDRDDNGGNHYTVTTGPTLEIPNPDDIVGQVVLDDARTTPAEGAIVYITVIVNGVSSQELSALVEPSGWWGVDLGGLRTSDYQSYFSFGDTDTVHLSARGSLEEGADSKSCTVAVARDIAPVMALTSKPLVIATLPASGATGIAVDVNITATFNQNMDSSTITANTFTLVSDSTLVTGTVTYDDETRIATFDPTANLAYSTTYTAGITTEAQSKAGYGLVQDHTWGFTTTAAPPGDEAVGKSAAFSIGSLNISPRELAVGKTVTINVTVTNTGGGRGSYEVTLKIHNKLEETKTVTVSAGTSKKVTFTTSRGVVGRYSVDVNGISGSFNVSENAISPPAPPSPPTGRPINWPALWGTIGGVIVIGLLVFFTVRRRSY